MKTSNCIGEANGICVKRSARLLTIEAVCHQFAELYSSNYPINEQRTALFLWIGNEARTARMALRELRNLVHDAAQKTQTGSENSSA